MVYLISPYKIRRDVHDDHLYKKSKRHGWFKITKYNDKNSSTIENFLENLVNVDTQSLQLLHMIVGMEHSVVYLKTTISKKYKV